MQTVKKNELEELELQQEKASNPMKKYALLFKIA